jgi:predicted Zn-dependent peptidase
MALRPLARIALVSCLVPLWFAPACKGTEAPEPPAATETTPQDAPLSEAEKQAILDASQLPATLDQPIAGDPYRVTVHRLSNGMTVYLSPDDEKPKVSAWIAVRTGSRNDPPDSTGLAHYLEHMLFKGTDELGTLDIEAERPHVERIAELYDELRDVKDDATRTKLLEEIDAETVATSQTAVPNEFDILYQELGVSGVNAFTWVDQTVYIANVPTPKLAQWATVESERMTEPVFRLFYPELEAVYEEKNGSLDDPGERVYRAMMEALFPKHPYGTQPTIGVIDHLKVPAYGDMEDYYYRWYRPNNMAIVLSGDVDESILPLLEEKFGHWQPAALEEPAPATLEPLAGRVFREVKAPGEQSVTIAFPTVAAGHEDEDRLRVMDWLASNDVSGIIDIDIVAAQTLPYASSHGEVYKDAGLWALEGTAREGQSLEEVEAELMKVVTKLREGAFEQADIDAIVVNEAVSEARQAERNRARVSAITDAYILGRDWSDVAGRMDRLRAIKKDEVQAVAQKYLGDGRVVVYRRAGEHTPPKIEKPSITPLEIDPTRRSPFAKGVAEMESEALEPVFLEDDGRYTRGTLPAGPVIGAQNSRNELFELRYRYDVGAARRPLMCHALDLLDSAGAGELDAQALRKRMFALGVSIDFMCRANTTEIAISGPAENMAEAVQLTRDWLGKAQFDDDTVKDLLANTLSYRKDLLSNKRAMQQALNEYGFFGDRSSFLLYPDNKALKRASGKKLRKELSRLLDSQHRTLYFGPKALAEVSESIALGSGKVKVKERAPIVYRKVKEPTVYFMHKPMAQVSVRTYWPNAPLPEADQGEVQLFSEVVGGMAGLIFQEMREARGLVYGASAWVAEGDRPEDQSALASQFDTQADKFPDAAKTMRELLEAPMQEVRVETARVANDEYYRGVRVSPRALPRWIDSWDLMDYASDPRPNWWKQTQETSVEDINAFTRRYLQQTPIICIIGDRERVDRKAMESLGKVVEVTPEEAFGFGSF